MNEKAKELEERGHFLEPELFKELKLNRLKGASAKDLKDRLAAKLVAKLGPKPTGKEVMSPPHSITWMGFKSIANSKILS